MNQRFQCPRLPRLAGLIIGALCLLWVAGCGGPGNRLVPDAPREQIDPLRLRKELQEMATRNLQLRRTLAESTKSRARADLADRIEHVEYRQAQRLDRIFDLLGNRWPDSRLVGVEGSRAALIVAQHIDSYRGIQRRALRLLKRAVRNERAPSTWVAYLTDRIRLSGGHPQLYGTQVRIQGGEVVPRPIADPDDLDERRAAMGLKPMDVYLERVRQNFDLTDHPEGASSRAETPAAGGR